MVRTRTDNNQATIYKFLREIGATVYDMSQYRCGFDTLVEYHGRLVIMEIKNPNKKIVLTAKEKKVLSKFRNSYIVETWEDALSAIGL